MDTASGRVYAVPQYFVDSVLILDAVSGKVLGHLAVSGSPDAIALDPATGDLYVATGGLSSAVSVYNATTDTYVTTLSVAFNPDSITFDPGNGDLYVAGESGQTVTVVDGSTPSVLGSISIPTNPNGSFGHQLAYDGWNNDLYLDSVGNLTVIDATNASVVGAIRLPGVPDGVAVANAGHRVFATDPEASEIFVVNASSQSRQGTIELPAGSSPGAIAYDASTGDLYVADQGVGEITVVNASTNIVVGEIRTGAGPDSVAVDSGRAFIPNFDSGNVTEVSTKSDKTLTSVHAADVFPVTLTETGLPDGTSWSSAVYPATTDCDGVSQQTARSSVVYYLPNGSADFVVQTPAGYVPSPSEGAVAVDGSPATAAVTFSPSSSPSPPAAGWEHALGSPFVVAPAGFAVGVLVALAVVRHRRRWAEEVATGRAK